MFTFNTLRNVRTSLMAVAVVFAAASFAEAKSGGSFGSFSHGSSGGSFSKMASSQKNSSGQNKPMNTGKTLSTTTGMGKTPGSTSQTTSSTSKTPSMTSKGTGSTTVTMSEKGKGSCSEKCHCHHYPCCYGSDYPCYCCSWEYSTGIDLQMLTARMLDDGGDEKGPMFRVWFRNNSATSIARPFSVTAMVGSDEGFGRGMPQAGVRIGSIGAGQMMSVDIRLPAEANRPGLPMFQVMVDSHREIGETSETNNTLVMSRSEILPVDAPVKTSEEPAKTSEEPITIDEPTTTPKTTTTTKTTTNPETPPSPPTAVSKETKTEEEILEEPSAEESDSVTRR